MKSLSLIQDCFRDICENSILTLDQGQRSWHQMKADGYMISYDNANEVSISHCFRDICENSIFDLGPRTKVMAANESPYMISYMSITQMKSLSLVVFKIFAKITFLTSELGQRSKVMVPNQSPYMISYMSIMQMKSPSLIVFVIFVKI